MTASENNVPTFSTFAWKQHECCDERERVKF